MADQLDPAEAESLARQDEVMRRREIAAAEAEADQAAEYARRIAALPKTRADRERKAAAAKAKAAGPQRVRFGGMARTALFETKDEVETRIPDLEGLAVTEDGKRFVEVVGLPGELETLALSLGARGTEAARRAARCVYSVLKIQPPRAVLRPG